MYKFIIYIYNIIENLKKNKKCNNLYNYKNI